MTTYYKSFTAHMGSPFGRDLAWSLPTQAADGTGQPGAWMPAVKGPLEMCANGYHAWELKDGPCWINTRIFQVEYRSYRANGHFVTGADKVCGRRIRLIRETAWDRQRAILFAADCAAYVLPYYEAVFPGDDRVRQAIEAARAAGFDPDNKDLARAARAAARAAHAAFAAAFAARAAAFAARAAAFAADAAAYAVDATYAVDAARAAARARAHEAAIRWQAERLALYLDGPLPAPYVPQSEPAP